MNDPVPSVPRKARTGTRAHRSTPPRAPGAGDAHALVFRQTPTLRFPARKRRSAAFFHPFRFARDTAQIFFRAPMENVEGIPRDASRTDRPIESAAKTTRDQVDAKIHRVRPSVPPPRARFSLETPRPFQLARPEAECDSGREAPTETQTQAQTGLERERTRGCRSPFRLGEPRRARGRFRGAREKETRADQERRHRPGRPGVRRRWRARRRTRSARLRGRRGRRRRHGNRRGKRRSRARVRRGDASK